MCIRDLLQPGARVVVGSGSQGGQPGGVGGDGVVGQGLDACGDELVDLSEGLGCIGWQVLGPGGGGDGLGVVDAGVQPGLDARVQDGSNVTRWVGRVGVLAQGAGVGEVPAQV